MVLSRVYTKPNVNIFDNISFHTVTNEEGLEYIVPQNWSQAAIDILLEKVFYQEALPALTKTHEESNVPPWLFARVVDEEALDGVSAEFRYIFEKDIRDVLHRVAGARTYEAWKLGVLTTEEEAKIFYDELRYILLHQTASLEIRQWKTAGLFWAYSVTEKSYYKPEQEVYSFNVDEKHALKRVNILGDTLSLNPENAKVNITLPVENIDSQNFIKWKRNTDISHVTNNMGEVLLRKLIYHVIDACDRESFFGFDPTRNLKLAQAINEVKAAGGSDAIVHMALEYAEQGYEEISGFASQEEEKASDYIRTTLSIPDSFVEAALTDHSFLLYDGVEPQRHYSAQKLWDSLAEALWSTGEPYVSFRNSIIESSIIGKDFPCEVSGGLSFLPGSQAPSASLNLLSFMTSAHVLDIEKIQHVTEIMMVALEAAVPEDQLRYRPVSLGVTNMSALLMGNAISYDSEEGRVLAGMVVSFVSGCAHLSSAKIAKKIGAFHSYKMHTDTYLQYIKDKILTLKGASHLQKGMTRRPVQIKTALCEDKKLLEAAQDVWSEAYLLGKETGFRHGHVTGIDTDISVQALLGAQTQNIVPETALVRFESYFSDTLEGAALYGRKLNPMIPRALKRLGYQTKEREDIHFYAVGHGTLLGAPSIHHEALRKKGFHRAALDAMEYAISSALHIRYAFNKWTLGEEFCRHILGFSDEDLNSGTFDMLSALGFSEDEIETANVYCCGTMTLEGAPHLKPEHLSIFDCVAPCGHFAVRRVSPIAQIKMQAAIEPFLSGAVNHTVLLDHATTIDDMQQLVLKGWELGVKNLKLYRDNSSLLAPVSFSVKEEDNIQEEKELMPCLTSSMIA